MQSQLPGKSLYLFSKKSRIRQICYKVVTHPKFDYIIILFILVSSLQLVLDSPLYDPNSELKQILPWIDIFTTLIFLLESILKTIAFGFILNGETSYLRGSWNIMDFFIIIMSILAITPLTNNLAIVKMFRVLRILRLVSKNEGL